MPKKLSEKDVLVVGSSLFKESKQRISLSQQAKGELGQDILVISIGNSYESFGTSVCFKKN